MLAGVDHIFIRKLPWLNQRQTRQTPKKVAVRATKIHRLLWLLRFCAKSTRKPRTSHGSTDQLKPYSSGFPMFPISQKITRYMIYHHITLWKDERLRLLFLLQLLQKWKFMAAICTSAAGKIDNRSIVIIVPSCKRHKEIKFQSIFTGKTDALNVPRLPSLSVSEMSVKICLCRTWSKLCCSLVIPMASQAVKPCQVELRVTPRRNCWNAAAESSSRPGPT